MPTLRGRSAFHGVSDCGHCCNRPTATYVIGRTDGMALADVDEFAAVLSSESVKRPDPRATDETENSVMDSQQVERHEATRQARRACLVEGCTCKDARIVSHRRAAFFSAWAKEHGETANRVIRPDPSWNLLFTSAA